MIDKTTAQKIKDAADIVDVVSDYVRLTRRGANYMGLCPFHNERTPSFSVNKAKNFCYCFSCHKGGSPVNFIMEKEGISYQDALRHLAAKYNIPIEEHELTDEERRQQSERESMMIANQWAMEYMQHNLTDTAEGKNIGLRYFYDRGITPEAIKAFRLGYALDKGQDLSDAARKAGYNPDLLYALGLIGRSREGREYDRFRGRVIFPILNSAGKVLAFGGRDLKGGPAKYINSPESAVYKKNRELYGMFQAKSDIVRENKCFLVEGYMDVIGMWQAGFRNVIASSGTALTDGQIALIHRFTNNVTLIYDGDAAGIKASLRGIDMLLSHNLDLSILLLPDGDDPDSFARKHTPEEFRKYVADNEKDFIGFKTEVLLKEASDNPLKRTEAVKSIMKSLASISDKTKRAVYIGECSRKLEISEEILAVETAKLREKVVEDIRKDRERTNIENNRRDTISSPDTRPGNKPQTFPQDNQTSRSTLFLNSNGYISKLEEAVITYCVRYGMCEYSSEVSPEGEEIKMCVAEAVKNAMETDEIDFTTPVYKKIFYIIISLIPEFTKAKEVRLLELQALAQEKRRVRYEELSHRNLDLKGLEKEELLLEESLQKEIQQTIHDFSVDYVSRQLVSHEDDYVRNTALKMVTRRHQLSKYHSKYGRIETEEDRLNVLLLQSILEWKQGILQMSIRDIVSELYDAQKAGDENRMIELQKQLIEYEDLRREFANCTGDRVILPKNIHKH